MRSHAGGSLANLQPRSDLGHRQTAQLVQLDDLALAVGQLGDRHADLLDHRVGELTVGDVLLDRAAGIGQLEVGTLSAIVVALEIDAAALCSSARAQVIERDVAQTDQLATGTIANGALRLSRVVRQTTTYRVRGPAKEPRQLIVVQRRLPGWTLSKPDAKGVELSEGNYRIPFQLPGGDQTQTFNVVQEQTQQQEVRLVESAADQIRIYAQAREFDAKTRDALSRVLQLQQAVADAQVTPTLAVDRILAAFDRGSRSG